MGGRTPPVGVRSAGRAILVAATLALSPAVAADAVQPLIPQFYNPDHRAPLPNLGTVKTIRFVTTADFPPFHFTSPDGTLVGFDVDLARAICQDLKISCTMQAKPFADTIGEVKAGHADAVMAAIADNPTTRADLSFTAPYYTTPARFAARTATSLGRISPEALAGRTIGAVTGTAHEAFLKTFFPGIKLRPYRSETDLRAALRQGEVDAIFSEAIGLAVWLNDPASNGCCAFRGGPYTTTRFFGNGVSIGVGKTNDALREALDYEIAKISADGTYADLYLKYFPISFY